MSYTSPIVPTDQHPKGTTSPTCDQDMNDFCQQDNGSVIEPVTPDEVLHKYDGLRITDSTIIPNPTPVITIAGEAISTAGNITTISGASKSGKSAFTSVLIAGAIADGDYEGLQDVEVKPNGSHKAVLHLDTEQAKHRHKHNLMTILRRCCLDECPDNLYSYNIRELPLKDYQKVTTDIVSAATVKHNGVHLIVVDGAADYIRDVNDADSSNAIVAFFERLAITSNCPIILIVHTNPGSDKERGHLGSQLQRKSESVLTVTTENDISTLQPKLLRNAGKTNIPLIQFRYDADKGYHVFCGTKSEVEMAKDLLWLEATKEIIQSAFGQKTLEYGAAIEVIMKASNKKERTSKDIFKEARAHGFIVKGPDDKYRLNL